MESKSLQLTLILDCTASMGPWISAAKEQMLKILSETRRKYPDYSIQVSFIGYRDFGYETVQQMFTYNFQTIVKTLSDVEPFGGDDECEDVEGAYQLCIHQDWHATVRLVVHICDAPAHGDTFHDESVSDSYPGKTHLLEYVRGLANLNVNLTVFQINPSTRIMFDLMDMTYARVNPGKFTLIDLEGSSSEAFYQQMSDSIDNTICTQDPTYTQTLDV